MAKNKSKKIIQVPMEDDLLFPLKFLSIEATACLPIAWSI